MKRLFDDLNSIQISNVGHTKKVIGKIEADIRYFSRHKNTRYLKDISDILQYFISINKNELYTDTYQIYRKKMLINELIRLDEMCKESI